MAEVHKPASAPSSEAGSRPGTGFELRLERGGAAVRLVDRPIAPGLELDVLSLQVPDVRFPFDAGPGAAQFRHRLSDLQELRIHAGPAAADAALARAPLAAAGLEDVRVAFREGFAEVAGRVAAGPAFTLRLGLLPEGDQGVRPVLYAPRLYGPAPLPAAALPHLAARVLAALELPAEPLPALLRGLLAPRGWKLPRATEARLARVEIAGGAARLAWERGAAGPAVGAADPDLLAADDGARTFAAAEAALARGDWAAAREALLAAGAAAATHPFGAERLLSLLVLEERFHDEALDVAAEWLARRPGFAPALAAEALVHLARRAPARAARAFAALADAAAAEPFAALAAAEAAFGIEGAERADALRAVEIALAQRRDHVPALRALRDLARAGGDREALLRAGRRLVAYDPDPAVKARAHAELGELLLAADPPAARLHLDQALRLAPDDPAALDALARACATAGEPLRAVRALDRLRELHRARGEAGLAARTAAEAGTIWEKTLGQAENALLRYREAAELAPSAEAHARAARLAGALGQWTEAADHHAAALAALDLRAEGAAALAVECRVALARVAEERLGDRAAAAAHLDAAAALAPGDEAILRRLVALRRDAGAPAPLARALDALAPLVAPAERAALLAEAGEALLGRGDAEEARRRFTAALAHDPASRPALLGLSRLAAARGDAVAERDALARLVPLAAGPDDLAALQDRLADAAARAGDLGAALEAARAARAAAPTAARLDAELALARRAGDGSRLAALLGEAATAAATDGDPATAAARSLERARLLAPAEPAAALAALAEARAAAPGDPAVLRVQADLAARAGDPRLALGTYRALLAGAPADAGALELAAARAALDAGEAALAREHAERAHAAGAPGAAEILDGLLGTLPDRAARAALLVRLGRHAEAAALFEELGDGDRALAAWEHAVDAPADAPRAWERLAELRLAGGDARGAAQALLHRARRAGGAAGAALALRAHALDPDAGALDVAIGCDPACAPARARRALLRAASDPRAALDDADAALAGTLPDGERARLLAAAAGAAAAAGDGATARRHLAAYCELAPDDDAALARLCALHRRAGDRAALAAALARRTARTTGAEGAAVRLELAELRGTAGDAAEAVALARAALAEDPASLPALRAILAPAHAPGLDAAERAALLGRLAGHADATPAEAAAANAERAPLLAAAGDAPAALAALRAAAAVVEPDDAALDLRAELAARAGDAADAATALLARARRAAAREEPGAGDRLADAALAAAAAALPGADEALEVARAFGPEPERARAVLAALVERARGRGDDAAEREALGALVPVLPTGARPAALLRLSALALAAGDAAGALAAAEEARTLAPRDPAAVEAARAAAEAAGDLAAVAARLEELAALAPAGAGARRLARARLLARLGRHADADAAYALALPALPPELDLAREHAALRRAHLPARPAAEPIEAFALRAPDPAAAARALRAAAALALASGDGATALRCARRAYARTQADPTFAGPLLARVLYLGGAVAEALVLHRRLLEAGLSRLDAGDALAIARQAAELFAEAGEVELARAALGEVLARRPQDLGAALARLALEPDRRRAAQELADVADACRSDRARVAALVHAAEAAAAEVADRAVGEALFARARAAASSDPRAALDVALRRAEAIRLRDGDASDAHLEAVGDAAALAQAGDDRALARALLVHAAALLEAKGRLADAARDLVQADALAAADGDFASASLHARQAGALLLRAGDPAGAAEAFARAAASDPAGEEAAPLLEEVARAQGEAGLPLLLQVLSARADRLPPGAARADALAALGAAWVDAGAVDRGEAALRAALEDAPGHADATARLAALLAAPEQAVERGLLLLRLADAGAGPDASEARREGAALLAAAPGPAERALAAEAYAVIASETGELEAHRAAAALLAGLDRREESIPHLAALVRADPEDEDAGRALAEAYADRHRERAGVWLARAAPARGEARARRLREAARALFAAGDDGRARALLREAFDAWPSDDAAFVAALRDAAPDVDRVDAVLAARAGAVPAEAASCHLARADALAATGAHARAVEAYGAALAAAPGDPAVLAALAGCLAESQGEAAARELDGEIVARAATPGAVPSAAEAASRYRLGLAAWTAGDAPAGLAHLERALALAPRDARAGLAWAAVADAHAAAGDGARALAAARRRAEAFREQGRDEERRLALASGADLAAGFGDAGPDAAELLDALLALRAADGAPAPELAALGERAAAALEAAGLDARAGAARVRAGLAAPEPEAPAAAPAPADPAVAVEVAIARVRAAAEPGERGAALVVYADALRRAGAPDEEVRAAAELACEADPDGAAPWQARARIEAALGDRVAAARAHLAVSIRAEGGTAAAAALEAARLFEEADRHGDAIRAHRAAVHARPGCPAARMALAEEALAEGDADAAADHLAAVAVDELSPEDRAAHTRRFAAALEAAGRPADAEAVWTAILRGEAGDAEAFEHAARLTLARGAIDAWVDLAQAHEQGLAAWGDPERRRDLRHARGLVFADAGRLEAARGAWLAALELDPGHRPTLDALLELDGRREAWAAEAQARAVEAEAAVDPAEAAALHLRRARILHERLGEAAAAAVAVEQALARARRSELAAARRTAAEAEALREALAPEGSAPVPPPAEPEVDAPPAPDPIAAVLRAEAEGAEGPARAEHLERLAGHLERTGDRAGAADALLDALTADPDRELTHAWLEALAEGDPERLARAAAIRAGVAAAPTFEPALPLAPSVGPAKPARSRGATADLDLEVSTPTPTPDLDLSTPDPDPDLDPSTPPPDLDLAPPPPDLELDAPPPLDLDAAPLDSVHPEPVEGLGASEPEASEPEASGAQPPDVIVAEAQTPEPAPSPAAELIALGRAAMQAADWPGAWEHLSAALAREPSDLTIARDLSRVAEKLGRHADYVALGEVCADAMAAYDPLAAAARFRHFAEVLGGKLGDAERASVMLEKALALLPDDPDTRRALCASWAERPETASRALDAWLELARRDPADEAALSAAAGLCARLAAAAADPGAAARLAERGRLAAGLAAFASPAQAAPPAPPLPARLAPELRDRVAAPGATSASARLLALLAPWLEPLFPADLARFGTSAADRVTAESAPVLRGALDAAARALGVRAHVALLSSRPGLEAAVENTQPPSVVLTADVASLPPAGRAFAALRTLSLVQQGWALAGKFAPKDVAILLELACRFAGGAPPALGLPAARAGAFLAALELSVPPPVRAEARALAPASAAELAAGVDPRALVAALRRSANRVALLYAGDPGAALAVLARLDRRAQGAVADPAQALELPDLRDLALFSLSEPFLELRLSVLG